MPLQVLCIIPKPSVNQNLSYSPETLNSGRNWRFFVPCDLEIWRMTLKNNRAPLLCCFKLCASFHSHHWILTVVTVLKRPIWVKIDDFFIRVTLIFDRWPSKTIGHLFYATWVTVQKHSIQVKISNFLSHVTLKFDRWPWKTIGHLFYVASSFVHHFIMICEFKLELWSGNG